MEIITYCLNGDNEQSDSYYNIVSSFADEVMAEAQNLSGPIVDNFREYIIKTERENVRSVEEYTLEFLTMGILYKIYSDDAVELSGLPECFLSNLYQMRQQHRNLKPGVDFLRGILGTLFLSPNGQADLKFPDPTLKNLRKLIGWMRASGEFGQEARRLESWADFLSDMPEGVVCHILATSITLALWFEAKSEEALGRFTPNVESFLNSSIYRWREDYIFCRRRRVEYHLNMVGAEILNRAFRKEFLDTDKKVVLLPCCMRFKKDDECRAIRGRDGYTCVGCTPSCRVNHLKVLGEKYNFNVKIIPHESSAFSGETQNPGRIGIVGIACVLNLLSGGWKARDMGLVPQCVLLDYCGCGSHWHKEGFPTDINMARLKRVLNIDEK